MVYRVYVEKKSGLDQEARALLNDARGLLGIRSLTKVRLFNRYDAEGLSRELFDSAIRTVFSEPQLDLASESIDPGDALVFAVEYLPGQFDQRADSAAQCIQIISRSHRPLVRSARVYALYGQLTEEEIASVKKHVINPVEAREASLDLPETLEIPYDVPAPVPTVDGFTSMDAEALSGMIRSMGLAMDADDLAFCQDYFRREGRDPTVTEIRVLDTYWSDHCRHTTFHTVIDSVQFEDALLQRAYDDYLSGPGHHRREASPRRRKAGQAGRI